MSLLVFPNRRRPFCFFLHARISVASSSGHQTAEMGAVTLHSALGNPTLTAASQRTAKGRRPLRQISKYCHLRKVIPGDSCPVGGASLKHREDLIIITGPPGSMLRGGVNARWVKALLGDVEHFVVLRGNKVCFGFGPMGDESSSSSNSLGL
ncbi:hypothetical protein AMECASPLE_017620 [Ameca splendens]|uniref:Uncharacterized protein n=1 Tax=Ameca splendens TaxID=208324 RepID=A0ABV0XRF9_9TELE